MPGYKGHTFGAIVCNTAYVGALKVAPSGALQGNHHILSDVELLVGLYVVSVLFGLFPDIDTNSKGQDIFFGLAFVADAYLIYDGRMTAAAFLGLLAMTPIIGHHRGWTHSKLAMILVPSPIAVVPFLYNSSYLDTALVIYGAALIGYFSHLLFDGKITRLIHIKGGGAYN